MSTRTDTNVGSAGKSAHATSAPQIQSGLKLNSLRSGALTFGRKIAPHPISLGSYGTDTHEIRRIVKDGVVTREGKTATGRGGFGPYNIGYQAIVPKQEECENLLVTFALSASHTAFSSIRMEPVFMVTSQSAATAAVLAIDDAVPVQQVDYNRLRARLVADGLVLDWPPRTTQ